MTDAMVPITYIFHLAQGRRETITLTFQKSTFLVYDGGAAATEPWVQLVFHQCRHCPLDPMIMKNCPFAQALSPFLKRFDEFYSYEKSIIEVITPQRRFLADGPLQQGMASLVGLIGATSGCPSLAFFRPMARFHLPFASEEETLCRVFSFHLLGQYLHQGGTGSVPVSVAALRRHYEAAGLVNQGMAERIRSAFQKDAVVNALVILDTFAQAAPCVIEEKLEELRYLFNNER